MTDVPLDDFALDDFALADEFGLAAESTPLLPVILEEIAEAGGRITFERFMALALGHPEHGYYSRPDLRWGRLGDYETSPEVHPIFGYLWARQVRECWERLGRPSEFALVEPGAGSGAFMASILTWLRARSPECFEAVRPVVLDGHPNRIEQQRATLAARGFEAPTCPVEHALTEDWLSREGSVTGVVISNEFFDALPVHIVQREGDELREVYVAAGPDSQPHTLSLSKGEPPREEQPPSPTLPRSAREGVGGYFDALGLLPADGGTAEVGIVARDVMRRFAARIERGYILTIDYGYEARELYASWRTQGTLMAFRGHSPQPDPLDQPGLTDLTYHVDFTTLAAAAAVEGFQTAPLTTQAEALTVLGLPSVLRAASERAHQDVHRYASERRAAETLTDMSGLGRIKVLAMAKDASLDGLRCLRPLESLL